MTWPACRGTLPPQCTIILMGFADLEITSATSLCRVVWRLSPPSSFAMTSDLPSYHNMSDPD